MVGNGGAEEDCPSRLRQSISDVGRSKRQRTSPAVQAKQGMQSNIVWEQQFDMAVTDTATSGSHTSGRSCKVNAYEASPHFTLSIVLCRGIQTSSPLSRCGRAVAIHTYDRQADLVEVPAGEGGLHWSLTESHDTHDVVIASAVRFCFYSSEGWVSSVAVRAAGHSTRLSLDARSLLCQSQDRALVSSKAARQHSSHEPKTARLRRLWLWRRADGGGR